MNQTAIPDRNTRTPRDLRLRIKRAYEEIRAFVSKRGNERLKGLWPEWDKQLRDLFKRTEDRPKVAISLVGGVGAGKSTLLNALIGARVLPVSEMRACTAAISEVDYMEGPYRARVEFIPREAWEEETKQLLADFRDAQRPSTDETDAPGPVVSGAVKDKLWTVYRPSKDAAIAAFDPFNLVEPPEIKHALDTGYAEIEHADLKDFRKHVALYLESKHHFWPIVKTVKISGPFLPLRDGAKIIDLPGINDPNEAREAVTKAHLKSCRFVWLVFGVKRGLTRDITELMQSDDFLRRIVMDGRADALTFVATAVDVINVVTGAEEFGLGEDAGFLDVVTARNREVRNALVGQLDELSSRLAGLAGEQQETAARLAGRLKASQIFTVSAQEFLRLQGLMKTAPAGFTEIAQTEIPALSNHMRRICAIHGVAAHYRSLERQLELTLAEIDGEVQAQQAALNNRADVDQRRQKERRAAVDAARTFLDRDLKDSRERLVQDLEAGNALLSERVKRAVERAKHNLAQTVAHWERMHALTIRAACGRGGTYIGSAGRTDFPDDLSKPILDGIAFAWADFFGDKLGQALERGTTRQLRHAESYRDRLLKTLPTDADVPPDLVANLGGLLETTEKILRELLAQTNHLMAEKIQQTQRTLYESVPDQVRANMQPAFQQAAKESGVGMKHRMVKILSNYAGRVSQVMFDDAQDALLNGVRSLNDWLAREFEHMIQAVQRNAALAAENLVTTGEHMSVGAIAADQSLLRDFAALVSSIKQEPTA